jgi:uncharacterized protein YbjQ (UPF0145 family)
MPRFLATAFLAGLFSGAAGFALAQSAPAAAPANLEAIPIHESVTSVTQRLEVVKHLWTESWRSALIVPGYESREQAIAAFREHAISLGGNGVVNFGCYRMPGVSGAATRLACTGTIVRFL